jgi:Uma2 family endonuclease
MRAVLVNISEADLSERRRTGIDRYDEMWEGILHMTPAPSVEHQRILDELIAFLGPLLQRSARGTLRSGINVFNEASKATDYRIPDLSFVAAGRAYVLAADGTRGGGPDAVIEVRSPDDETYEKFAFYAAIEVREIIVIDRDTKRPEIYRLAGAAYVRLQEDRDTWLRSETMNVRFRQEGDAPARLHVVDCGPDSTDTAI